MDTRYETFLKLCEIMNYRKTAEILNMTQPAVTRQIKSLEAEFNTKLFVYDKRKLEKTESSDILKEYILSLRHNYNLLKDDMQSKKSKTIKMGATKTIGEYVIDKEVIKNLENSSDNICFYIDNTANLLQKLENSEIDFAIVEGIFNKNKYNYKLFKKEQFCGICSYKSHLAGRKLTLEDIFSENIIVREKGSGTRDIFESEIIKKGYNLENFNRVFEISSFAIIENLVARGDGISFVYKAIADSRDDIETFELKGLEKSHDFNIVWLKNSKMPEIV